MNSLQRILAIYLKELRLLARDKPTLGMVVMVPLIQLLLFGYAINTDVRHLPVAVVDFADNSGSRKNCPMDLLGSVVYLYKLADACDSGG
ncbi:hypothetical protein [Endozoicomonas euniceicola]|uniref:ABC-2 type transporter domain-containing protein n=1 Tax=Endozoicomonas euniceicola TaxID=1234143 RepID=A0ABY6GNW9_9GAMM|nr:hypothetical protein [Endozoicomonas euniceicola]UYM14436.1 hypothetical protein NX720_16235 [Endozoicomonas euniceicola]